MIPPSVSDESAVKRVLEAESDGMTLVLQQLKGAEGDHG